jgi:hypothetical protein
VQHDGWSAAEVELQTARAESLAGGLVAQIESRTEAAAGAGEHDDAHVGVLVRGVQRAREALEHRGAERVQAVGTVERDRGDVVTHLIA